MTMQPHRFDLTIVQGATFYLPFAIEAPDGTTYNLANVGDGYTHGRLTIRDRISGTALVVLTTDNGGVVIDYFTDAAGVPWSGYWFMSAASTALLEQWGDGVHNFEISDAAGNAGNVERPFEGSARLNPEVVT